MSPRFVAYAAAVLLFGAGFFFGKPYYLAMRYPTTAEQGAGVLDASREPKTEKGGQRERITVTDHSGGKVALLPVGSYEITGRIALRHEYPGTWSACPYRDVPIVSLALAFGKMADDTYYRNVEVSDTGSSFRVQFSDNALAQDPGTSYAQRHITFNDLIAANENIDHAIRRLEKDEIVGIKGLLVDIDIPSDGTFRTSDGPADFGGALPGNAGANEIIYVTELTTKDGLYK